MTPDRRAQHPSEPRQEHPGEEGKDELEKDARRRNPDPTTRREALELELMEEDHSELGEEIGDEID